MFSGIIESTGKIINIQKLEDILTLSIEVLNPEILNLNDVKLGDSIACNGVCLTVTRIDLEYQRFSVDVSQETLRCTCGLNLVDNLINLERALPIQARLDGHIVSGHVDSIAEVISFENSGECKILILRIPVEYAKFVAIKGSLTVNGVSLTINKVSDDINYKYSDVSINLIPHTLEKTNLHQIKVSQKVNIEIDLLARYIERMLNFK